MCSHAVATEPAQQENASNGCSGTVMGLGYYRIFVDVTTVENTRVKNSFTTVENARVKTPCGQAGQAVRPSMLMTSQIYIMQVLETIFFSRAQKQT
jgi:hypothetical protein